MSPRPGRRTAATAPAGRPRRRLVALVVITVLVFTLLALRVVQLQALEPERFVALSEEQTVRSFALAADRGSILDRHGHELALSIPQRTVFTDPKFVEEPSTAAAQLAPILGRPATDIEAQLSAENRFGYLARQVSDDVAEAVEALELPGVYTIEEPHRFAPSGDLATSLLGLTDIDNVGLGGLELQYEDVLAGTPGHLTFEQDPEGRTIAGGEHELVPPESGDSVMLTIDRALQHEAELVLAEHVETNGAEAGMMVATDPRTGEILAMANVGRSADTGEVMASTNNLALTTVYEPGSVMKIVGMSGALEDGLVSPQGACVNAPDSLEVGGGTFSEYSPHGGGCWPLEDVIVKSSNTGSINIALMLGPDRLAHYFSAFGLGQPTGLGFPERAQRLRPAGGGVVGDVHRQHADRAGHLGHAAADAAGLQHDRQRRALRASEPGAGHRGRRRPRTSWPQARTASCFGRDCGPGSWDAHRGGHSGNGHIGADGRPPGGGKDGNGADPGPRRWLHVH